MWKEMSPTVLKDRGKLSIKVARRNVVHHKRVEEKFEVSERKKK
jgi:hypothetical protein